MKPLLISLLLLFIFDSCHQNKSPEELIDTFYQNKTDLDLIIQSLQTDKKLDSLFWIGPDSGIPDIKESYPNIYSLIKKTGITDASSHNNSYPRNTSWYYLKTNWPNEYPIYLIYNAYDSTGPKKGEYLNDEGFNETWGLGDYWTLFRLKKIKSMKQ